MREMIVALRVAVIALLAVPAQAEPSDWRFSTVQGTGGVPLNVVAAGQQGKPGILFIHGYGMSALSWAAQLDDPELQNNYHLVAFDLRGHGASGKPWRKEDYLPAAWAGDIAAVMAAAGLKRPAVVAWSFGGNIVMHYVREHGISNIGGLQFVGTVGRLAEFVTPPEPADPGWVENVFAKDMRANIRAAKSGITRLTEGDMSAAQTEQAMWVSATLPVYAKQAIGYGNEDNSDLVPRMRLPVRLSTGEFDRLVTPATVEAAAASLPQSSIRIYEGVGHSPFAEASEAFNRDLMRFVAEVLAQKQNGDPQNDYE